MLLSCALREHTGPNHHRTAAVVGQLCHRRHKSMTSVRLEQNAGTSQKERTTMSLKTHLPSCGVVSVWERVGLLLVTLRRSFSTTSRTISLSAMAVKEYPRSVRIFIECSVGSQPAKNQTKDDVMQSVCDTPSSKSITMSVVRPHAYRNRTVWITTLPSMCIPP